MGKSYRDSNGTVFTPSKGGGNTDVKKVGQPRTTHTTDWVKRNYPKSR